MAFPHERGEPTVHRVQAAGDAADGARGEGSPDRWTHIQRTLDSYGCTTYKYIFYLNQCLYFYVTFLVVAFLFVLNLCTFPCLDAKKKVTS